MPQNGCQNVEGEEGTTGKTKEEEGEGRATRREGRGKAQRGGKDVRASEAKVKSVCSSYNFCAYVYVCVCLCVCVRMCECTEA